MPSSTLVEQDEYALPEDVGFPAMLESVEVKTIKYKRDGKDKSFDKWRWTFVITDGDYAGLHGYGETEDRLTTHPDNKVRQWAEVLRDMPFQIGEGLDTDEILGLPCVITVSHAEPRPKKDGDGAWYDCPVKDVFPEGTVIGSEQGIQGGDQPEEPPF